MKYILTALLFLLAAIVQSSVLPYFPLFGVYPNVVLILAVCWTIIRGEDEAMIVIPIAGVSLSLVDSAPFGVALLAMTPVLLLSALRAIRLTQSDVLLAVLLVFVGSLLYEMVFLVALRLLGESVDWWHGFLNAVVPSAIVNALFTPVAYWFVWMRSSKLRRARAYA